MEVWTVLGYRTVDFTDRDGNVVKGYNLFLHRIPEAGSNISGVEVSKIFISNRLGYVPALKDKIQLSFNRYGKISSIQVI